MSPAMTRFSQWASQAVEGPAGKVEARPQVESYVVVNSMLQSRGKGIKYRRSTNMDDKYANKVATFGSVVRGTLHNADWLKIGNRMFLPVKIDGLYVLVRADGGGLSIVRREAAHATMHFRLQVAGCRHEHLGKLIVGTFARVEDHHGKPAYRRVDGDVQAACYFWDKRSGERYSGWWFGPTIGCEEGWALNPSADALPPRHGWEVPWGEQVDPKLSATLVECRSITVSGHANATYDGQYDLQPQAMNGYPWFKKMSPFRVLYCFSEGNVGMTAWNLDHREQSGVFDWSDGGTFQGGHIPLGTAKWMSPYNRLTLTCEAGEDDTLDNPNKEEENQEHDPWALIEPWEVWYSEKMARPVYYNSLTGERADSLEDTSIHPGIIRSLKRIQPTYNGTVDRVSSLFEPAARKGAAPAAKSSAGAAVLLPADAPTEPGVPYVVARIPGTERHVAKIHKSPDPDSREYTFVKEGGLVELFSWDPTQKWRMCWHAIGLDHTTGCWAWVSFFDTNGQALFKPKDWLAQGPLPFGLLGVAIYEDDRCLLRQLLQDRVNLNRREQNLTPLTLAEVQGRADICVRLLDAGAPLPSDVNRPAPKTPTGALLSALAGKEDFDLRAMDIAMDQLGADMRDVAERMLDRIAEEQRLRRQLGHQKSERERGQAIDESLARKAREEELANIKEREAQEAERWAREKAEKRRMAKEMAALNEERLRRIEQERLEQVQMNAAASQAHEGDRAPKPKGEMPVEPAHEEQNLLAAAGQEADADAEMVRQRRAKMMEKRSKRMVEAAQSGQSVEFAAAQPGAANGGAPAAAPPSGAAGLDAPPAEKPAQGAAGPDQALIEMRREKSRKLREERQRRAKEEAQLQQQHEEKIARLKAEGEWGKVEREQRAFEIQQQEAQEKERRRDAEAQGADAGRAARAAEEAKREAEAEAERRRRAEEEKARRAEEDRRREAKEREEQAAMDKQLKGAQDKWTCGECNFDNPQSSNICLFCDTERGDGAVGHRTT